MSTLHLRIVSPEGTFLDKEVHEVILPAKTGQIAVLPHHMPLVAELTNGEITIKNGNETHIALVYGGFVYVKGGNEVLVLADSADHIHDLNEVEILEARRRAETAKEGAKGNNDLLAASEAELSRITFQLQSLNRHSVLHGKSRHKHEKLNN